MLRSLNMWFIRTLEKTFLKKNIDRIRGHSIRILPSGIELKRIFKEYSYTSTIHGIKYLADSKTRLEQVWWILALIGSIIACEIFIGNIYNKWHRSPVIVSFENKRWPVVNLPLPAVTICPQVKNQQRHFNFSDLLDDFRNGIDIDEKYASTEYTDLKEVLKLICPRCEILQQDMQNSNPYYSINVYDSIRNLAPPKSTTIVACGVENFVQKNCTRLFQRVISENGLCYTFNALSPHQLYRDDILHSMSGIRVTADEEIPEFNWTLEKGYQGSLLDSNIYPFNSLGAVLGKPISFVFSLRKDDLTIDCETFQGFKIFLHPQNEMPLHTSNYVKLPIQNDLRIYVIPRLLVTTDEVVGYTPDQRGCFFNHERHLRLFKEYSETNCHIECIVNYTAKNCDCVPFHMPRWRTAKICGPAKQHCRKEAENKFIRESFLEMEGKNKCRCKPACSSITYDVSTESAPGENLAQLYKKLDVVDFESYLTSTVSLIYSESLFTRVRRREFFSRTDVVANCGGILGLFMGVSIISFIEVFYYAIIRPYFMNKEYRTKNNAKIFTETTKPSSSRPNTMENELENELEKRWIGDSRVQYIADINH